MYMFCACLIVYGMSLCYRRRKGDYLCEILNDISTGNLNCFKDRLKNDATLEEAFKQRLKESRVPENSSPLVVAISHNQLALFKHILDNFDANIEQETSALLKRKHYIWGDETFLVDNPVEGATPLWIASSLAGCLDFVKELVSRGANIEHTTNSKSSPLHGSASYGRDDVCKFLMEHGATVDQPDELGQTPLTVAAVVRSKECVELLIEKGANVIHKDNLGNTPLHAHANSDSKNTIEITEILIKAGAQNCANNLGYTPAILSSAACSDIRVVQCIEDAFHLDAEELCDYYCLNAAMTFLDCCTHESEAARLWLLSVCELRRANPDLLLSVKSGEIIYDCLQEPTTEDEVNSFFGQGDNQRSKYFLGLMICERVLGRSHPMTAYHIRYVGDHFADHFQYDKCAELWQRSIDFKGAATMPFVLPITDEIVSAVYGFSVMVDRNYTPLVAQHFQWGLRELTLTQERKTNVACCLFRMLAVWIKVRDCIKEPEQQKKETELISKAAKELIMSMDSHPCPVLVACLQNIDYPDAFSNYYLAELVDSNLPLHKTIALFLDLGCSVHCEDELGNFPLHLAVKLQEDTAPLCVKTLLEYGAHIDALNFDGKTALDLASESYSRKGVSAELENYLSGYLSLQCMAAKVVVKYFRGCYENLLPPRLVKFVSWHEEDQINTPLPVA